MGSEEQQAAAGAPGIDAYPVEFTGSGGEYFRVWLVNVLLTVVTLGLYTPYARRRTARWFYGHTLVAGSPLEFTAEQRRMTIGFILLAVLYGAFKVAAATEQDMAVLLMFAGGALLAPYFWGSAMRFRLNATRWRGVRLQFTAKWSDVYRAGWPLFVVVLGWALVGGIAALLVPDDPKAGPDPVAVATVVVLMLVLAVAAFACVIVLDFNAKCLVVKHGRIGGQEGRWKPRLGDFVRIWLRTAGLFIACVVLGPVAIGAAIFAVGTTLGVGAAFVAGFLGFIALFASIAPARAYRQAKVFRLVWSNIGVSRIARFKSDLDVRGFVWLRVRNVLLTIVTLGFYRPFAVVNEYRMRSESVTLHVKGGLDQLAGQLAREEGALGDAAAAAVGLDLVT